MIGVFVTFIRVLYGRRILYVCVPKESVASFGITLMKTPMEHYLADLCPVLHFTATNFQEQGCHVI